MAGIVKVWDPVVRVFHWGLVLSFAVAWLSADQSKTLHHWAGYAAGALIALRLVWGLLGTRYARFSQFVHHPSKVLGYLRDIVTGKESRYLGHNPAGGAMIVALILTMGSLAFTGWLSQTDQFFGVGWVEDGHKLLAKLLLVLVVVHIGGVVLASLRHRENLPWAMITGWKRETGPEDIA
ncbi:cytochrome b561 [Youhaiella tibetensis]|uniref:Cytochrome B n=1 Tax=Paradevosia tibetensis TaxID=1447062 RepID=A0A5B9DU25_9HYPH|nr:cytochrome b/b6 domain-containing protein [Youhaiella tibetensis]AKR56968.1 cytochrome B561 [Devosia sp. H5989]QEE21978.1 cytochrome B [Youhaiella tibetensis]GGF46487.1 cytochrome b561 [Youhaiella tibetensis]